MTREEKNMSSNVNNRKVVTVPCIRRLRHIAWEPRAEPKYTVRPIIRRDEAETVLADTGHATHSDNL